MKIVWTILLLLWIALGTIWSKKTLCGDKKAKPSAAAAGAGAATSASCDYSLIFDDGDNLNIISKENFTFKPKASRLNEGNLSSTLVSVLERVAGYLEENPDRALQVTGHYHEKEGKPSSFDNLGLARSAAIINYLKNELGIAADQLVTNSETVGQSCYDKNRNIKKGATMTFGEKK